MIDTAQFDPWPAQEHGCECEHDRTSVMTSILYDAGTGNSCCVICDMTWFGMDVFEQC